jgi:hypothetical protein
LRRQAAYRRAAVSILTRTRRTTKSAELPLSFAFLGGKRKDTAMRPLSLSILALLGAATVLAVPKPGFALNHSPIAKEQGAAEAEQVGYRYRRRGYRPYGGYYRPYYDGYYRPYYRPYYG